MRERFWYCIFIDSVPQSIRGIRSMIWYCCGVHPPFCSILLPPAQPCSVRREALVWAAVSVGQDWEGEQEEAQECLPARPVQHLEASFQVCFDGGNAATLLLWCALVAVPCAGISKHIDILNSGLYHKFVMWMFVQE